jgi:AraC-like DNA-binding protein
MAKDFRDGHHIAPHCHERAQLVFAAHGAMVVSTAHGAWAVPPQRAVWMPAGVTHEIRMGGDVAMRTLYVRADAASRLPTGVRVLAVSPLLRELILRACALPLHYDESGPAGRLVALILDEIAALPTVGLDLPLPRDLRLGRVCRALAAEPGDTRSLADWGRAVGASPRTLARLFARETGWSFAAWRQQARLLAATAMLAAGQPITRIALDLGYESSSAFTAMFKRALGAPPSQYLAGLRRVDAPPRGPAGGWRGGATPAPGLRSAQRPSGRRPRAAVSGARRRAPVGARDANPSSANGRPA